MWLKVLLQIKKEVDLVISDNVKRVKENIIKACETAGRNPQEIELVGVTKTVDEERILTP